MRLKKQAERRVPREYTRYPEPAMWLSRGLDYYILGVLEGMGYSRNKITNREQLKKVLLECWDTLPQSTVSIDQFRPHLRKDINFVGKHIEQFFSLFLSLFPLPMGFQSFFQWCNLFFCRKIPPFSLFLTSFLNRYNYCNNCATSKCQIPLKGEFIQLFKMPL